MPLILVQVLALAVALLVIVERKTCPDSKYGLPGKSNPARPTITVVGSVGLIETALIWRSELVLLHAAQNGNPVPVYSVNVAEAPKFAFEVRYTLPLLLTVYTVFTFDGATPMFCIEPVVEVVRSVLDICTQVVPLEAI